MLNRLINEIEEQLLYLNDIISSVEKPEDGVLVIPFLESQTMLSEWRHIYELATRIRTIMVEEEEDDQQKENS